MLLLAIACSEGVERRTGRQVVSVALPEPGDRYGPQPDAPVSFVEFGSHACPACRRFAIEQFPLLDSLFFRAGRARYRYVDVSPHEDGTRLAGLVECLSEIAGGLWEARVMVYRSAGSDHDALADASARQSGLDAQPLNACADSIARSARVADERDAARALGVPGTPTFLVGEVTPRGYLVGWPSVGLVPIDTLVHQIEDAEALVRRRRLPR